jgi:hypothetical protein
LHRIYHTHFFAAFYVQNHYIEGNAIVAGAIQWGICLLLSNLYFLVPSAFCSLLSRAFCFMRDLQEALFSWCNPACRDLKEEASRYSKGSAWGLDGGT